MKPQYKILLIVSSLGVLNYYFGLDIKFTIINLVWCVPIAVDWVKQKQ